MPVSVTKAEPKFPATEGLWKSFQVRWGITMDDKPGDETYGMVRELETAYWKLVDEPKGVPVWIVLVGFGLGAVLGAIAGAL